MTHCFACTTAQLEYKRHHPSSFLRHAEAFLEQHEAENNILLGRASSLRAGTLTLSAAPLLATVEHEGTIRLAALRTPPHDLILTRADEPVLQVLATALHDGGCGLPGVTGPARTAATFARIWAAGHCTVKTRQQIHRCEQLLPLEPANGHLRAATPDETAMLARWAVAHADDMGAPLSLQAAHRFVVRHITDDRLFVWDDGKPVSMATVGPTTRRTVSLPLAYTPPEHEGRGYDHSCIGATTRRLLRAGHTQCLLHTSGSDPRGVSYQRLGYQPVCETSAWRFDTS